MEDCLQMECAINFDVEYIITRNIKDFKESCIPAIEPQEFLKICWAEKISFNLLLIYFTIVVNVAIVVIVKYINIRIYPMT